MWRAADTATTGWTSWDTYATAYTSHSHLTKRPAAAVARATAGKVLAGGCTRQGQSTRRGLSSPYMRPGITSTTWSVDRATWPISSPSLQRRYHLRPSRPGWPWAASIAYARKAHTVEDNGGAEACSSAPQAACPATLVTLRPLLGVSDPLVPDLILGPRKPLDFGELQQPVRRDTTRFFGTMCQRCRWTGQPPGSTGYQTGTLEPQPDEYGPRRPRQNRGLEGGETVVAKRRVVCPGWSTQWCLPRRTAAYGRIVWPRGRLVGR